MEFKTPLCEIAYKHKTDKCPQIRHDYTPTYYELLKDKRDKFKKILELGIGSYGTMKHVEGYIIGASLKMWKEFFPKAQIYGVDNDISTLIHEDRISTFLLDTTNEADMKMLIRNIGSDIDLVIDDGPHYTGCQIATAKTLLPLLKKDVLYVIEDTKNPERIKRSLPYNCEIVSYPEKEKRDNYLVIVRK